MTSNSGKQILWEVRECTISYKAWFKIPLELRRRSLPFLRSRYRSLLPGSYWHRFLHHLTQNQRIHILRKASHCFTKKHRGYKNSSQVFILVNSDCHLVDIRSNTAVCRQFWGIIQLFQSYLINLSTRLFYTLSNISLSNGLSWIYKDATPSFEGCLWTGANDRPSWHFCCHITRQHSPMAQVLLAVCCWRSVTIWAFWVGEQRQQTTAGHWHANSTNSCS